MKWHSRADSLVQRGLTRAGLAAAGLLTVGGLGLVGLGIATVDAKVAGDQQVARLRSEPGDLTQAMAQRAENTNERNLDALLALDGAYALGLGVLGARGPVERHFAVRGAKRALLEAEALGLGQKLDPEAAKVARGLAVRARELYLAAGDTSWTQKNRRAWRNEAGAVDMSIRSHTKRNEPPQR